ncbi:tripartite tricarboxylate transporter substrate binding protein [Pusillimonas sp. TS35]|uniref:Bug family tripartite tricarboxylate transporter substrate binding protein n=1 Tax=Paracandidimonas lactea TaxID=2895524 RepID=UPI00137158E5|nr:tripartite tricarboxylate transporter substrate binding protein [Paracandidimonas lactea]MYN13918.1 tripartite tricarboxylate transporter substrate binding protein [Pusillimonas sp. TS35]
MQSQTPKRTLFTRRHFLATTLATVASATGAVAYGANPRGKPVRVVVPFPPGGPTDMIARIVSLAMGEQVGSAYVIDNKSGASGMIGANAVAKAQADGSTLLMNVSAHVINPLIYKEVLDDPLKDFTPITKLASTPIQLVVSADSPFKTFEDLVTAVKANPEKYTFASSSIGAPGHLTGELFKQAIKRNITHVPYKGSAPALTDVIGGQVSYMFDSMPSSINFVRSGRLRALGVTAHERVPSLPDVPTFAELGYPTLNLSTWYGLWAPANTPEAIVQAVYANAKKALTAAAVIKQLEQIQAYPGGEDPQAFSNFCREETTRYASIIQAAGIKPV